MASWLGLVVEVVRRGSEGARACDDAERARLGVGFGKGVGPKNKLHSIKTFPGDDS
jgi:hypothetical protein